MTALRVETTAGVVEGVPRDGVTQFRGIPFAAAPVGEQRFLAPEPVAPWTGVRQADVSRTSPPQLPAPLPLLEFGGQAPMGEDCLELDIYTPAADDGGRPVMVWFYGGGFTIGSASTYDATSLAARGDVVVVAVNYRLGALGFSYLEHLDDRFRGSANVGLRDQIASLRWVRDNIARFGGDPGCVTIFGESAGGHSVGCLLTSPEAESLFHRCILQSGAGWGLRARDWAEEVTGRLLAQLGLSTVQQLQAVGVDAVLAAQGALPMRAAGSDSRGGGPRTRGAAAFPFAPLPDGVVLRGEVLDEVAAGRAAPVPILICHTRDEIKLFAGMGFLPEPKDSRDLAGMMATTLPDGDAAVAAYRNAQPDGSLTDWYVSFLTDQNFHMPDFRLADVRLGHDARVWMARFSWESPAGNGTFGACHGLEIPFLFWRPGQAGGFLDGHEVPRELANAMQDAWAAFARTGDPNCAGLPAWPRYEALRRSVMNLDTEPSVVHDPDGALRALWQDVVF
jgi:para-nitrobenzyl esterase